MEFDTRFWRIIFNFLLENTMIGAFEKSEIISACEHLISSSRSNRTSLSAS
jgi:hypothetical protein